MANFRRPKGEQTYASQRSSANPADSVPEKETPTVNRQHSVQEMSPTKPGELTGFHWPSRNETKVILLGFVSLGLIRVQDERMEQNHEICQN